MFILDMQAKILDMSPMKFLGYMSKCPLKCGHLGYQDPTPPFEGTTVPTCSWVFVESASVSSSTL